ncbi:MAG: class B sortase [Eubacterium sp.]|nr:class B sortase [Eubacterium sp.]
MRTNQGKGLINLQTSARLSRLLESILDRLAVLTAVLILLLGSYAIWDNYVASNNSFISDELLKYKPGDENRLGLTELHKINPDVCAWLTIDKTHIDYPVVKSKDNIDYLNKDVKKNFALGGSIFVDAQNSSDFSDRYTLIFGHHMANGAMFGDVANFLNAKYFKEHRYGSLTTLNQRYKIEIFACLKLNASDSVIYNSSSQDENSIANLIEYIRQKAVQKRNLQTAKNSKLIALSTCSEADTNGRIVLIGILHKK